MDNANPTTKSSYKKIMFSKFSRSLKVLSKLLDESSQLHMRTKLESPFVPFCYLCSILCTLVMAHGLMQNYLTKMKYYFLI